MRTQSLIVVGLMVLISLDVTAQTPLTTDWVDVKTYELWSKGHWDELIQLAEKSLDQGIDFYYLRYRLGIAWFQKKNYQKAVRHFKAAREMNSSDPVLDEYLYYSLAYSGWEYLADDFLANVPSSLQKSIGVQTSNPIKQVYLAYSKESGAGTDERNIVKGQSVNSGYQLLSQGHDLLNIGVEHKLDTKIWVHHSYNFIQKAAYRHIVSEDGRLSESDMTFYLNQYYLGLTYLAGTRWELGAGGQFVNLSYDDWVLSSTQGRVFSRMFRQSKNNYLGYIRSKFSMPGWNLGATSVIGDLGDQTHFQQDLHLELYPKGNTDLYSISTISYLDADLFSESGEPSMVFHQTIGLKMLHKTWIEGFLTVGSLKNFTQSLGSILYNDTDVVTKRVGVKVFYQISTPLVVRLDFAQATKESIFVATSPFVIGTPIEYHVSSLTAVLIWNF